MSSIVTETAPITHWLEFTSTVRAQGCHLLRRLNDFPHAVLITGCQRSGTTILTRVIAQSEGMVNFWTSHDDELDAALILSGYVDHTPQGRYCFQTTFVNECYREYFEHHGPFQVIWVLRNPLSVIYSILYNWKDYAFDELFEACGAPQLTGLPKALYQIFGRQSVNRLRRACLAYNGKVAQLFEFLKHFGPDRLLVVDYDDLVQNKTALLPGIYQFINLTYQPAYADQIHASSLNKASRLSAQEIKTIDALCGPIYRQARQHLTPLPAQLDPRKS